MVRNWDWEFKGANEAATFLGVDRGASLDEIERAFEQVRQETDRWTALEAREVALADKTAVGRLVTAVLCDDLRPEDLTSVLEAQTLFDASAPPRDDSSRYYNGIERTANEAVSRLTNLQGTDAKVTDENIETVQVAQYALRYRDVKAGKQHVLGNSSADYNRAWRDSLSPKWDYSVNTSDGTEFYIHDDMRIELWDDSEESNYLVRFLIDGEVREDATFQRYGEAKLKIKQWILEPPST